LACIAKLARDVPQQRVAPQGSTFEMLEPCDGKLSRTVLRGERGREAPDLPGRTIMDRLEGVMKNINAWEIVKLLAFLGGLVASIYAFSVYIESVVD